MLLILFLPGLLWIRAQEEEGQAALHRIIQERNATLLQSLLDGDANRYSTLFTENAFIMYPGVPILRGRENIYRERASNLKKVKVLDGKIRTTELDYSGNLAYEIGSFQYTLKAEGKEARVVNGKYLVIWKRGPDGIWYIKGDVGLPD